MYYTQGYINEHKASRLLVKVLKTEAWHTILLPFKPMVSIPQYLVVAALS